MLFFKAAVLAFTASGAFATIFITSPTASTTFEAGKKATITWQDSKDAPALSQWGNCKVSIYTGNANQQTQLQQISASVDVSKTSAIEFTPDASIGPNGNQYFIRIESLSLKDSKSPQYPALAFSASFRLSGMTGTFSSAIQAQIAGQSTAPIGGSAPLSTSSVKSTGSTTASSTTASHSASATNGTKASAASTSSSSNAATSDSGISASGFKIWTMVLAGVAAGALVL